MKRRKYVFTYDMVFMNIFGILIMFMMGFITFFVYKSETINIIENGLSMGDYEFFLSIVIMVLWMVLHECIHGIFYFLNGAKWQNIKFGIAFEKGILYCKSCEKINKKNILISVIAPLVLIGIVTYIIGIIINNPALVFLSILNIVGACGDIIVFIFFLSRQNDLLFKEIGDTTTFYLETTEDLRNRQFLGIKLVKEINSESVLKDDLNKKVNISKCSKVFIIIMVIILLLSLTTNLFNK